MAGACRVDCPGPLVMLRSTSVVILMQKAHRSLPLWVSSMNLTAEQQSCYSYVHTLQVCYPCAHFKVARPAAGCLYSVLYLSGQTEHPSFPSITGPASMSSIRHLLPHEAHDHHHFQHWPPPAILAVDLSHINSNHLLVTGSYQQSLNFLQSLQTNVVSFLMPFVGLVLYI